MGEQWSYDLGFCDGPVGTGIGVLVSFGCFFFVFTNMLPILEAATGGRVSPRRLWNLAVLRGHWDGILGVDYSPISDCQEQFPWLWGDLTSYEELANLEDTGTPNDIADVLRDRGFWMWMRPDR